MKDYKANLLSETITLKNYLEEYVDNMSNEQAQKAVYKIHEIWAIIERRQKGRAKS